MINKIHIQDFKAFHNPIEISLKPTEKNLLIYGENGSGKTSLFQALRLAFFNQRIIDNVTSTAANTKQEEEMIETWKRKLENTQATNGFFIKLNDISYDSFSVDDYEVYMLNSRDIDVTNKIPLREKLKNLYFTGYDDNNFLQTIGNDIISEVNEALHNTFKEDISIRFDGSDQYNVCIKDDKRTNIDTSNELSTYFNEAKLHIGVHYKKSGSVPPVRWFVHV